MMVDGFCSQPNYVDHVEPVLEACGHGVLWVKGAARRADRLDRPVIRKWGPLLEADAVVVASGQDAAALQHAGVKRLVYLEHGAGQAYEGDPRSALFGSYSGGLGLDHVDLFLCPSETVADRWRARYPAPAVVVGSPLLDRFHRVVPGCSRHTTDHVTVGFTFHWECMLTEETRSAWGHYERQMPQIIGDLREEGMRVVGHQHPRWPARRGPAVMWKRLGVEQVSHREFLEQCDVVVADNTSVLPEAASVGARLVWLNAPWWRRDVHHQGRFWDWPAGQVQCDTPDCVVDSVREALIDRPSVREAREAMVASVYDRCDGHAAERAAAAVRELCDAVPR